MEVITKADGSKAYKFLPEESVLQARLEKALNQQATDGAMESLLKALQTLSQQRDEAWREVMTLIAAVDPDAFPQDIGYVPLTLDIYRSQFSLYDPEKK